MFITEVFDETERDYGIKELVTKILIRTIIEGESDGGNKVYSIGIPSFDGRTGEPLVMDLSLCEGFLS